MARKAQLTSEQMFRLQQQRIDGIADILALLIKSAMWVALAYFALLAIRALAGRTTSATFALAVHWLSSERKAEVSAWIVAFVAIIYGMFERSLRKRKTSYMQERIRSLESKMDPDRTSTGLTESGDTPAEDHN
jgi:hypothetical protein